MGEVWSAHADSDARAQAGVASSSERTIESDDRTFVNASFPYAHEGDLEEEYSFEFIIKRGLWAEMLAVGRSDGKEVKMRCMTDKSNHGLKFSELEGSDVFGNYDRNGVAREIRTCLLAKALNKQIEGLPGANRISNCFKGYFPNPGSQSSETSVCCSAWSYAGPRDLRYFYIKHVGDDETVALMVFKQLLEALALLASLEPPVIHWQIKPESISVSDKEKGYSLLLEDLGHVHTATESDLCGSMGEPWNRLYRPAEERVEDQKKCPGEGMWMRFAPRCGDIFHWTNEKECGAKFDIFSAGVIFMEIVYNVKEGAKKEEDDTWSWRRLHDLYGRWATLDHDALNKAAEKESASKELAKKIGLDLTKDTPFAKAFPKMVKTLYKNPRLRPSPAELLKLDVFKDIKTP